MSPVCQEQNARGIVFSDHMLTEGLSEGSSEMGQSAGD